ncbi:hypothetical protein [Mesorhizobium sp. LNJC403B00]|uniref:hypothetical protein n=1 Tax=Mesorhizobium sp. LNJC403B00 TaxID=1287280 RepID=UPI0003CDF714|nr:hypothetical protein [Mesorhizobium sp. LNJC403B00]ESX89635.1 hypothetical protein X754_25095 [Mesorhizobium sp. LNJC403B00]
MAGFYSRVAGLWIQAESRLAGQAVKISAFCLGVRLTPTGLAAIRRFADFGQNPGFDLIGENASLQGFDGRLERCPSG